MSRAPRSWAEEAPDHADVVVIGAGVCGCSVARELARYDLDVVVVEKEVEVNRGTSHANSAMIHSGVDPIPGSLKARFNVRGNELYPRLCEELSVSFQRVGAYVVACSDEERPALQELQARGEANGVRGLRLIEGDELREREPKVLGVAALATPSAGIVNAHQLTPAIAENAAANGVRFVLDALVTDIETNDRGVEAVVCGRGRIEARYVVNAAGLFADEVAALVGPPGFSIRPRKGEYYVLDKEVHLVDSIIFPTPSAEGKGICVAPTTDGNTLLGPTAQDVDDKTDLSTTAEGLALVLECAQELCAGIEVADAITSYSGLRAVPSRGDFVIGRTAVGGFLNVAGMESPGLTAAPAIAEEIAGVIAGDAGAQRRNDFDPVREPTPDFSSLPADKQAELVASDPDWGIVVCRCEQVTRREVLDAIRSPVGARTLDGVKFRTRAGAGRCQGGFCLPRLVAILSEELSIPPEKITRRGPGSELFVGPSRRADGDE